MDRDDRSARLFTTALAVQLRRVALRAAVILLVVQGAAGRALADDEREVPFVEVERRADARRAEASRRGRHVVANVAVDDRVTRAPWATSEAEGAPASAAFDGDLETAWRGGEGTSWELTLPFRRVVHLGFVRVVFGDDARAGVPAEYRWEVQPPVAGRCEPWGLYHVVARRHDRDGNEFLYGPKDVHARRQALFLSRDACALRLVVSVMEGSRPVVRELEVRESAPSLLAEATVDAPPSVEGSLWRSDPKALVDDEYETAWAGSPGGPWRATLTLRAPVWADRLSMTLGVDAVTVPRRPGPGRSFSASSAPVGYRFFTAGDDDDALVALPEADDPSVPGLRRRVVRFAPRPVKRLVLEIPRATDADGRESSVGFPIVRGLGLYAASDERPVLGEPWFLSVNANPAAATRDAKGGEAFVDGLFARETAVRLTRIVAGFDRESRWPAEPTRPRDASTGRFLEAIEGDDPSLSARLLLGGGAPPVVFLSGSLDWEYDAVSGRSSKRGHYLWDVRERADTLDRGMGQLADVTRARAAPFVGFCGGAQILALLEAGWVPFDEVVIRNSNQPIRGLIQRAGVFERAWWSDPERADASRPTFVGVPGEPLFDFGTSRRVSRQLPSSHGDMVRASAFSSLLSGLRVAATTDLCGDFVDPDGLEPIRRREDGVACVTVPQAFRGSTSGHALIGLQFHPEQRDLSRLAPGMPDDARGDALNVFANALDLVWDGYLRESWPR